MLHVAFFCLVIGQVPPPPVSHPPESYERSPSPNDQPPADPQSQREWLLSRLVADLQAQGKLNAQKRQEVERMVSEATDRQVNDAVQYYQQQLAQAKAKLRRLQADRDNLKRDVERRKEVYAKEQAITAYGSALAAQQAQSVMGNFYAGQARPYYAAYPPAAQPAGATNADNDEGGQESPIIYGNSTLQWQDQQRQLQQNQQNMQQMQQNLRNMQQMQQNLQNMRQTQQNIQQMQQNQQNMQQVQQNIRQLQQNMQQMQQNQRNMQQVQQNQQNTRQAQQNIQQMQQNQQNMQQMQQRMSQPPTPPPAFHPPTPPPSFNH